MILPKIMLCVLVICITFKLTLGYLLRGKIGFDWALLGNAMAPI